MISLITCTCAVLHVHGCVSHLVRKAASVRSVMFSVRASAQVHMWEDDLVFWTCIYSHRIILYHVYVCQWLALELTIDIYLT